MWFWAMTNEHGKNNAMFQKLTCFFILCLWKKLYSVFSRNIKKKKKKAFRHKDEARLAHHPTPSFPVAHTAALPHYPPPNTHVLPLPPAQQLELCTSPLRWWTIQLSGLWRHFIVFTSNIQKSCGTVIKKHSDNKGVNKGEFRDAVFYFSEKNRSIILLLNSRSH